MVDGPSGEHDLVLKGRLACQAPEIDASVYLTECDPSAYAGGDVVEVEIAGTADYDLIARPVAVL
jgi:ribosomal protein S12 methylthiotransferase